MMQAFGDVVLLQHARAAFPDGVRGFLLGADIGAGVSYGYTYEVDGYADGTFMGFPVTGADSRNGYDLVNTAQGPFCIVSYAEHAAERGMSQLQAHIAANPEYYAQLQA